MAPPSGTCSVVLGVLMSLGFPVDSLRSVEDVASLMAGVSSKESSGLRASGELASLVTGTSSKEWSDGNLTALALAGRASTRLVGRTVKCNVDSEDSILECGDSLECSGECSRQAGVDFAGADADDACTQSRLGAMGFCISTAHFMRRTVQLPGVSGTSECCLCPVGKVYDPRNGWCVTEDLNHQQLPCSRFKGSCSDERQLLDLAGSSPEAACRTRSIFVTKCPETARSRKREKVSFPEVFPNNKNVYCCICPENAVYNSVQRACVCRVADNSMELILPKDGRCPPPQGEVSQSPKLSLPEAERLGPARRQIANIQKECLDHRFLDEVVDPQTYKDAAVRKSLGDVAAIVVDKVEILALNTLIKFDEEPIGTAIDFLEDLELEVGIGSLTIFTGGKIHELRPGASGFAASIGARISGKELLSRIVEFGVGGNLKSQIYKFDVNFVMELELEKIVQYTLRDKILGSIFGNLFMQISLAARGASVEGPLQSAMQGRDIYPILVRTGIQAPCPELKLCLSLDFKFSHKQEPKETQYGVTYSTMSLRGGVKNDLFFMGLSGDAKLDVGAALDEVLGAQTQSKLDVAYGITDPQKKQPETTEAQEEERRKQEAALRRSEICMKRIGDWDFNVHRKLLSAVALGGRVKRILTDVTGSAYGLYRTWFPPAPLKVNSTPGPERGDMEAGLMEAWQELHPAQKGIFARNQEDGEEPKYGVTSVEGVDIQATGMFRINAQGEGLSITGVLSLDTVRIKNFRKDSCEPTDHLTKAEDLRSCWKDEGSYSNDLDIVLAPTTAGFTAEMVDDGVLTACVNLDSFKIEDLGGFSYSGVGWLASSAANSASWLVAVKRMVEDALEAQLAAGLYKIIETNSQDLFSVATLNVILKPGEISMDLSVNVPWPAVGRMLAKKASVPPKLARTGATQAGLGSAWEVLREQLRGAAADPDLAGTVQKFTYDPAEWMAVGKLSLPSELIDEMSLKGDVDFVDADVPVRLSGTMQINLNRLIRAKVNDAGVKELGQYRAAAHVVKVQRDGSWQDMEAVVSCGVLFLSEVASGEDHFRITRNRLPRFEHKIDITRSSADVRRDGKEGFFEVDGACEGGWQFTGVAEDGASVLVCTPQDSGVEAALSFEIGKRTLIDEMILDRGYEADMLWSQFTVYFKSDPFDWVTAGGVGGIVESSCRTEVQRCGKAIQCMGVQFHQGECNFLSIYDVQEGVGGSFIKKAFQVGPPESWGSDLRSVAPSGVAPMPLN